ncbi:hypothetical protein M3Y99_01897100 [Aphelenchoides fujianensis]|nr:hypothetical protein M3Y99_01897100 [Aphelenchoides fujianensis]
MEPPTRKVLLISAACILAFGVLAFVWFLFDHFHVFGDEYPRRFYRAVLFDQGGVLVPFKRPGDMPKFQRYLGARPAEYEAYVACERGETTFEDIAPMLEQFFPGILEVTEFES